ncbi:zinc finger, C2H2 type [Ostertagia ostertagi]
MYAWHRGEESENSLGTARPPQSTEFPGDHGAGGGTSTDTASHTRTNTPARTQQATFIRSTTTVLIYETIFCVITSTMSRRKQLKPQPVKEDGSQSCMANGDESNSKKKRMLYDSAQVKPEPCDDETDSINNSINNELKLDCQFCGASFESISDLQTHTLRDHLPMPVPSLECQHCFAALPSFAAFVIHMRGHLNDREETSRCPRCPLSFNDTQVGGASFLLLF